MDENKLNLILDVKVKLTVRLGSCQLAMRDVLDLSPGSVLQLDQRASDPIGIYANDKLLAHGEVVVADESFCIKITNLVGEKP